MRGLGGWTLLRRLGAGDHGEVWLAERADERAALKRHRPTDAPALARFLAGADVLARLAPHPGVVAWVDGDLSADPPWYVTRPACRGTLEALGASVDDQRGPRCRRIAAAVAQLHASGVCHGDVAARNVLLTDRGWPVLADLDLAAARTPAGVERDLWGLGQVLHVLLTGAGHVDARVRWAQRQALPEGWAHLLERLERGEGSAAEVVQTLG